MVVEQFKKWWLPAEVDFVMGSKLSADHCILARKYYTCGRTKDAAALFEQTYRERYDSEILGPTSLHILRSKYWLALTSMQLGDLQKAQQFLEECLEATTQTLEGSHKDTYRCMNSLAIVCGRMGLNEKAERLRTTALIISRKASDV